MHSNEADKALNGWCFSPGTVRFILLYVMLTSACSTSSSTLSTPARADTAEVMLSNDCQSKEKTE